MLPVKTTTTQPGSAIFFFFSCPFNVFFFGGGGVVESSRRVGFYGDTTITFGDEPGRLDTIKGFFFYFSKTFMVHI